MTLLTLKAHFVCAAAPAVAPMAITFDACEVPLGTSVGWMRWDEMSKDSSSPPSHLGHTLRKPGAAILPWTYTLLLWHLSSWVPTLSLYSVWTDREVQKGNGEFTKLPGLPTSLLSSDPRIHQSDGLSCSCPSSLLTPHPTVLPPLHLQLSQQSGQCFISAFTCQGSSLSRLQDILPGLSLDSRLIFLRMEMIQGMRANPELLPASQMAGPFDSFPI